MAKEIKNTFWKKVIGGKDIEIWLLDKNDKMPTPATLLCAFNNGPWASSLEGGLLGQVVHVNNVPAPIFEGVP